MDIRPTPAAAAAQPCADRSAPDRLEQAFLEEMMKYAFPEPKAGAFSGGAGEEQFGSFLTREYAAMLAGRLDLRLGFDGGWA